MEENSKNTEISYDLIIIGGGPAGTAAAVYAGRKRLRTLLVATTIGGQSITSNRVENWIGDPLVTGHELADRFERHLRAQDTLTLALGQTVTAIEPENGGFTIRTDDSTYQTRALVLAVGSRHRLLEVPGEKRLIGQGVAFCSTCDAPFFAGKTVAVVGGGNSGLEAVIDLRPYARELHLFVDTPEPTGDPHTWAQVRSFKDLTLHCCRSIVSIIGDGKVSGLEYLDAAGERTVLPVDGVFVEIGLSPNTGLFLGLVELNEHGEIIVDHQTGATSRPGVFAAGDATDDRYKQNNIAAGDGVRAALSAYHYLIDVAKLTKSADNALTDGLVRKTTGDPVPAVSRRPRDDHS